MGPRPRGLLVAEPLATNPLGNPSSFRFSGGAGLIAGAVVGQPLGGVVEGAGPAKIGLAFLVGRVKFKDPGLIVSIEVDHDGEIRAAGLGLGSVEAAGGDLEGVHG